MLSYHERHQLIDGLKHLGPGIILVIRSMTEGETEYVIDGINEENKPAAFAHLSSSVYRFEKRMPDRNKNPKDRSLQWIVNLMDAKSEPVETTLERLSALKLVTKAMVWDCTCFNMPFVHRHALLRFTAMRAITSDINSLYVAGAVASGLSHWEIGRHEKDVMSKKIKIL